jgi:hypothetical protein
MTPFITHYLDVSITKSPILLAIQQYFLLEKKEWDIILKVVKRSN